MSLSNLRNYASLAMTGSYLYLYPSEVNAKAVSGIGDSGKARGRRRFAIVTGSTSGMFMFKSDITFHDNAHDISSTHFCTFSTLVQPTSLNSTLRSHSFTTAQRLSKHLAWLRAHSSLQAPFQSFTSL